jgi:hypothetical protein
MQEDSVNNLLSCMGSQLIIGKDSQIDVCIQTWPVFIFTPFYFSAFDVE